MSKSAMTGNVQGFELPRGCLMTTGVILVTLTGLTWGLLVAFGG